MVKGTRARERAFTVVMWVVSVVLAGFLIGLGGLIIGDLPRVSDPVQIEQFVDTDAQARLSAERARLNTASDELTQRRQAAEQALTERRNDYNAAQETFDNWIAARTATTDPAQDPQVLARTRELDALKAVERGAEQSLDDIQVEQYALNDQLTANDNAMSALHGAAYPRYEQARFVQELGVFGLRLAFTLPLLAISAFFLLEKTKGDYWPLKRGFVLFAAFAFFVELVPYLPEYGGYVRYGVGVVVTLIAAHFIVRWMRAYLKSRETAEAKAEVDRKKSIQYEEALKKMAAKACPGCDRPLAPTGDVPADYCMHCGMHLFNRCPSCEARKFAFFRYCMKCGTPAQEKPAAAQ